MEKSGCKVCITGGSGYVASWLANKLLHKGYTVHATLRNLGNITRYVSPKFSFFIFGKLISFPNS